MRFSIIELSYYSPAACRYYYYYVHENALLNCIAFSELNYGKLSLIHSAYFHAQLIDLAIKQGNKNHLIYINSTPAHHNAIILKLGVSLIINTLLC